MSTKASHFSPFVQGTTFSTTYDYLPLRMIVAKEVMKNKTPFFSSSKATMEICRRSSLALAPLTFTLAGLSFGIGIGRVANKKGIFWAIGLCSFYMICFLLAKSFKHGNLAACLVYFIPHPIIAFFSLRSLARISKGVE
jgi:lipopolysaccharide export LptBFGC system permease protein LptF